MSVIPGLSEDFIRHHSSVDSFGRGQRYQREGYVAELVRRGATLQATIHDSQYGAYIVNVTFDNNGIKEASCTCLYTDDGWCKHIVAALLATLYHPAEVYTGAAPEALLAPLNRDQLLGLLLRLTRLHPALADDIEREVALLPVPLAPPTAPVARPPIDPGIVRHQVQALLRPRTRNYDYSGHSATVIEGMERITEQVSALLTSGDVENALRLLEGIIDEFVGYQRYVEDGEGELADTLDLLGTLLAEALLSMDFPPDELEQWSERISGWIDIAMDYDVDDGLRIAAAATEQGWHHPDVLLALRGQAPPPGVASAADRNDDAEDDDEEEWADEEEWDEVVGWDGTITPSLAARLVQIRLRVLERQGRTTEYLALAAVSNLPVEQATMLAGLGHINEALEISRRDFQRANDALALAQVLREQGALNAALEAGEYGLQLAAPRDALGSWLAELAAGQGRHELALRATRAAFNSRPTLSSYQNLRELSGAGWEELKGELLDQLRNRPTDWLAASAVIDIFLYEQLIDDAITVVDRGQGFGSMERVMDAAVATRPEWVISRARQQAEQIMDNAKSQYYDQAIGWLHRVRAGYRAAHREQEWIHYLADLREKHRRKYKLIGLMKAL